MHRIMFTVGASFGISGASAGGIPGSLVRPIRSREERLELYAEVGDGMER